MDINKDRLTAFIDAIIAIAATIMVLELVNPHVPTLQGLAQQWPIFLAYLNSFAMIYLVWYKHNNLFNKVETVSMRLFFLNGVWLFFLTLVPFATGWVSEFPFSPLPESSYALILLIWPSTLEVIDRQIIKENPGLERAYYHEPKIRIFNLGFIIAMIVAYIEPILCLTIIFLISIINVIVIIRKNKDNV